MRRLQIETMGWEDEDEREIEEKGYYEVVQTDEGKRENEENGQ